MTNSVIQWKLDARSSGEYDYVDGMCANVLISNLATMVNTNIKLSARVITKYCSAWGICVRFSPNYTVKHILLQT
jgi:hypothetical protein